MNRYFTLVAWVVYAAHFFVIDVVPANNKPIV